LTFFLLILLATLGTGFLGLLPVEMRSAQRDRAVVQSAYGADAAMLSVMNDLYASVADYDEIALNVEVPMANGWSYAVESVEQIAPEEFRVTTRGSLRGVVQRRAVALIDDGSATEAVKNVASTIDGEAVGAWPATVPIKGDILWMGTWTVNNGSPFNMNAAGNPPFQGTIYQTQQDGNALMKESYTSGNPTVAQYPNLYTKGMAAIQPAPEMAEEELLNSTASQEMLLREVLELAEGANIQQAVDAVGARIPAKVAKTGTALTGGIFINDANGNPNGGGSAAKNQREFTVRFTAPSPGVGVTTYTRGDGTVTTITTIKAGTALPGGIAGPSTSAVDRIAIRTSGGPSTGQSANQHITELLDTDINAGHVVYVDGEIISMQGTFRGNRTIGVRGDTTIDGELLKSDTVRGQEPAANSKDALGIVGTIKASNNSVGTNINITNSTFPTPPDNIYYIYAYLTGLDGNDTNNKLFKQSSIPSGTKVHLIGSLQFAPSNGGLMGQTMDFVEGAFAQVTVDPLRPYGFPGANRFIPRLRAYVDIPVVD
jgi:hypothetical protein